MNCRLLASTLLALLSFSAGAAETKQAPAPDPFDTSAAQKQIAELGVPTPAVVTDLQAKAAALRTAGKWKEAAAAYALLARTSNWLANLVTAGLRPFYNADYDDRTSILRSQDGLVEVERKSNAYRSTRDDALVSQAECLLKLGDTSGAVAILSTALETLNGRNVDLWRRARADLYSAIQFKE